MRLPALLAVAIVVWAQDPPTFKTRVSLVHVDAEVLTEDGRIVKGLTKSDFRILDDGKEEPIVQFAAGDDELDLILLFDISGSMKPKVQQVAAAAREGVQELRPGDRVAIMAFNTKARLVLPFTDDLDAVRRSIQQDILALKFGGGTLIQSAVSDAARRFLQEPRTERRRAILIITDDMGQRTRREATVVRELWEADALLTGLIVRGSPAQTAQRISMIISPSMLLFQAGVKGMTEKTGGDFIQAADPAAGFQESMRRIRTRYSLFYAMPQTTPGARRAVRVQLAGDAAAKYEKAKIRARTGYRAPESE